MNGGEWVKPTFSSGGGTTCCAEWRKASFSATGETCAEEAIVAGDPAFVDRVLREAREAGVPEENLQHPKIQAAIARGEDLVLFRTSTNPGNCIAFTWAEWLALILGMKAGEFTLPPAAAHVALEQLQLPPEKAAQAAELLGLEPVTTS